MSRRARTRMHHPRRAAVNSVQIAINNARKLPAEDVARQDGIVRQAVAEFWAQRISVWNLTHDR